MIVLISMNILARGIYIFVRREFGGHPLGVLYPILDLDIIIKKYQGWKGGTINAGHYILSQDIFQLLELFLEKIPSFFLGLYAMVLKGEINISILLSVVSSALKLCNKLIHVSGLHTGYLYCRNPKKLKIKIFEYIRTVIEFISRSILVLFVYVTRPWGAWILFIVKASLAFIYIYLMTSGHLKISSLGLWRVIGSKLYICLLSCMWGLSFPSISNSMRSYIRTK